MTQQIVIASLILFVVLGCQKERPVGPPPVQQCTPQSAGFTGGSYQLLSKATVGGYPLLIQYSFNTDRASMRSPVGLPKYKELQEGVLASWMKSEAEYQKNYSKLRGGYSSDGLPASGYNFAQGRLLLLYLQKPETQSGRNIPFIVDDGKKVTVGIQDSYYCQGKNWSSEVTTEVYTLPKEEREIVVYTCPVKPRGECGPMY
jgi:hypothetical protein